MASICCSLHIQRYHPYYKVPIFFVFFSLYIISLILFLTTIPRYSINLLKQLPPMNGSSNKINGMLPLPPSLLLYSRCLLQIQSRCGSTIVKVFILLLFFYLSPFPHHHFIYPTLFLTCVQTRHASLVWPSRPPRRHTHDEDECMMRPTTSLRLSTRMRACMYV